MDRQRRPGERSTFVERLLRLAVALGLLAGAVQPAAALPGGFKGNAYGAISEGVPGALGKTLHKVAYRPLPCGGTNGATLEKAMSAYAAGTNGGLMTAATVTSTVVTTTTDIRAELLATTTLTGVSLFDGLITAVTIKAVATVVADAGAIRSSSLGSLFDSLAIGGQPIAADVAPGTRLGLPGIGSVALWPTQISGTGSTTQRIIVDMLTIAVSEDNSFGLPVGSTVVVGHAQGTFSRAFTQQPVGGQAWSAHATDSLLESNGFIAISCDGTGGRTTTKEIGPFEEATMLIGGATTTGQGSFDGAGTSARTSSTVRAGSLLAGRITFKTITAVAEDRFNGSTHLRSAAGTTFDTLRVLGGVYAPPLGPNLRVALPGIGYVILNEQRVPAAAAQGKLQVNGLRVVIDTANELGLRVGSELFVAHADANAQR
jgi:hypothetical protein